jgi:hypothetical protein
VRISAKATAAGLVIIIGLAAGCSSHPSLAQDQAAVNRAQATVSADQLAVDQAQATYQTDSDVPISPFSVAACVQGSAGCPDATVNPQLSKDQTAINRDQAKLTADRFKLQVAQDQLKKDENG